LGRVDTRPLLAHFTGHRDVPLLVDIDEQYPVIGRKRPGHGAPMPPALQPQQLRRIHSVGPSPGVMSVHQPLAGGPPKSG